MDGATTGTRQTLWIHPLTLFTLHEVLDDLIKMHKMHLDWVGLKDKESNMFNHQGRAGGGGLKGVYPSY